MTSSKILFALIFVAVIINLICLVMDQHVKQSSKYYHFSHDIFNIRHMISMNLILSIGIMIISYFKGLGLIDATKRILIQHGELLSNSGKTSITIASSLLVIIVVTSMIYLYGVIKNKGKQPALAIFFTSLLLAASIFFVDSNHTFKIDTHQITNQYSEIDLTTFAQTNLQTNSTQYLASTINSDTDTKGHQFYMIFYKHGCSICKANQYRIMKSVQDYQELGVPMATFNEKDVIGKTKVPFGERYLSIENISIFGPTVIQYDTASTKNIKGKIYYMPVSSLQMNSDHSLSSFINAVQ